MKCGLSFFSLAWLLLKGITVKPKEIGVMRAWLLNSYEGVEKLSLGEVEDPRPGPDDVLLKIRFAALNPADTYLAKGMYPAKPSLPHILGRDGVGDVVEVGSNVSTVRVGETLGVLRGDAGVEAWGTLAEKAVVPATNVVPMPQHWSLEEMAGAPLVFLTAWQALTQWNDPPRPPRAGSVLLVSGASGGVGTASLLLGRSMDLTVVALSRNLSRSSDFRHLGADFVFNSEDPNLGSTIKEAIAPKAVDLAVDTVAGSLFEQIIRVLGHGGHVSSVGRSGGLVPEFNTATLFFRRIRIGGVAVADYPPSVAQAAWRQIVDRLGAMRKRPIVDKVYPFEAAREAFSRLAQGPLGKVVVRIAG